MHFSLEIVKLFLLELCHYFVVFRISSLLSALFVDYFSSTPHSRYLILFLYDMSMPTLSLLHSFKMYCSVAKFVAKHCNITKYSCCAAFCKKMLCNALQKHLHGNAKLMQCIAKLMHCKAKLLYTSLQNYCTAMPNSYALHLQSSLCTALHKALHCYTKISCTARFAKSVAVLGRQ